MENKLLDGKRIKVERAPEPTDVIWENLKYEDGNNWWK